jgi:hypothetical protein
MVMSKFVEPSYRTDNAIGFNPAKQILTVVYDAIRNRSQNYSEIYERLSALQGIDIPLAVLVGRQSGSNERLSQLNLPTDTKARKTLFNLDDRVTINPNVRLFFQCSELQCFIHITDGTYLLNHLSMPVEKGKGEIHFKEDIANQGNYYEFVPFTNPKTPTPQKSKPFPVLPTNARAEVSPTSSVSSTSSTSSTIYERLRAAPRKKKTTAELAASIIKAKQKQGGSTRRKRRLRKTRKAYI